MPQIAEEVAASGGLYIIAHPTSVGDPICTGCDWVYRDMMPGPARVVEIWNTEWESESNNEVALKLWYNWLNQGYRMTATAGTDIHREYPEGSEVGFNVVYAEALSEAAILQAIRHGHLYVSSGPTVEFTGVAASGARAMMGDALPQEDAELTVTWRDCGNLDALFVILDGEQHERLVGIHDQGQYTFRVPAGGARWCTVEIHDVRDHVHVVTNPIFFGAANFH